MAAKTEGEVKKEEPGSRKGKSTGQNSPQKKFSSVKGQPKKHPASATKAAENAKAEEKNELDEVMKRLAQNNRSKAISVTSVSAAPRRSANARRSSANQAPLTQASICFPLPKASRTSRTSLLRREKVALVRMEGKSPQKARERVLQAKELAKRTANSRLSQRRTPKNRTLQKVQIQSHGLRTRLRRSNESLALPRLRSSRARRAPRVARRTKKTPPSIRDPKRSENLINL